MVTKPPAMTSVKSLLVLFFFTTGTASVIACGNEYYEMRRTVPYKKNKGLDLDALLNFRKNGDLVPYWYNGFFPIAEDAGGNDFPWVYIEKFQKLGLLKEEEYEIGWEQLEAAIKKNVDYKLLSDYAWNALKFGNKETAVKLLEILYKAHPDEYNVVANLGTAYEVTGKNEKALELLRKAVAINPASHYGSEWIHIKILEQKVKEDPDYTRILDLKADPDNKDWAASVNFPYSSPDSLMVQLAYQLHERIGFVPKPDPIVGQLVKDFASLVALTHTKNDAAEFYKYAISYDSSLAGVKAGVKPLKKVVNDIERKEEKKKNNQLYFIAAGVLAAAAALYLLLIRRRK